MDEFARVSHAPIVMTNHNVGHGGTYHLPRGGEFTRVALAWLDWQLKGNADASKTFLSEDSELRRDPIWTVELKNFRRDEVSGVLTLSPCHSVTAVSNYCKGTVNTFVRMPGAIRMT